MASSLDLARQYTSFSGVDIKVLIDGSIVGTMQAVSYAIQREKAPIYVMGKVDPLSFSRGKRGIAGTMISIMLDQHLIWSSPWNTSNVVLDDDEIIPGSYDNTPAQNNLQAYDADALNSEGLTTIDGTASPAAVEALGASLQEEYTVRTPTYVDQVTPFDISIVAANEYGKTAMMRIYGCEILNEGSGFSIDDIVIENQMTYICRTILPWRSMGQWDITSDGAGGFTGADGNEYVEP